MKIYNTLIIICGLVLTAACTRASGKQSQPCHLHGYVKDAITKKPVSGVIVSATAPGTGKPAEAVTDADGYFHFSELPSNQVNLQFGKKGYHSYRRLGVVINDKATVKMDVDFLREEQKTQSDSNIDDSEYPLLKMLEI